MVFGLRLALVLALLFQLSLKPKLSAQSDGAGSSAAESTAQTLRTAEAAFERGRPDYILARQALEEAMRTDDTDLKYRANLLQARLDSAGRRYSRALPYYRRAEEFRRQTDQRLAAEQLEAANTRAATAERERTEAVSAQEAALAELEAERESANWQLLLLAGIALALIVAGILAFVATTKKLNTDVKKARAAQRTSESDLATAQEAVGASALTATKQLRRVYQSIAARIPEAGVTSAANKIAAQNAALSFLKQSSFEKGGRTEVAMEAFFEKFNPELTRLINPRSGATLITDSMPLRLPIEQAVPLAFVYTELVGNALRHGEGTVKATMTKEGQGITLTVGDEGGADLGAVNRGEGLKLVSYFADELNARIDYPDMGGATTRLRFDSIMKRGAAAAV